jgi:peptidoglycan/xylan/chitin deacetylase (PgdA/CDA1 family)
MHRHPASTQWIPILGYHRVVDEMPPHDRCWLCMSRRQFERQMEWFARLGYRTLSLAEAGRRLLHEKRIPPRHFVITFDDGYLDTLTVAAPVLRRFGFTATMFVVTGLVGEQNTWDDHRECLAPLMNWEQIRQWRAMGFSVGSHTVSHPRLSQIPLCDVRNELVASRRTLEAQLGMPVQTLCYPYGDWSEDVCRLVPDAGYAVACNDVGRREHGPYILARTDPRCWPTLLAPLVCSEPWYFAANRRGMLPGVQRAMHFLWHNFAHQPAQEIRPRRTQVRKDLVRHMPLTGMRRPAVREEVVE